MEDIQLARWPEGAQPWHAVRQTLTALLAPLARFRRAITVPPMSSDWLRELEARGDRYLDR